MKYYTYSESDNYSIALFIKQSLFNKESIKTNYVDPLVNKGLQETIIAVQLEYNEAGKCPASFIKEVLNSILPELQSIGVSLIYVIDSNYFKVLTGQAKVDPHLGYVLPCKIKGFTHLKVILGVNHQALIYNPDLQAKLDLSLATLVSSMDGSYKPLGAGIIHSAWYPEGLQEVSEALESLHQYPSLTADIEGFSLRFNEAGIATIAFAWDKHNGIAFACDYLEDPFNSAVPGGYFPNPAVHPLLKKFFETYQGNITWHSGTYDLKAIIYSLWMKDLLDTEGLLKGLEVMTKHLDDTKIITYLATNSTAGNQLGLKQLAHEFAGNWAVEDIKDIRKIPLKDLLQYNLVDALSTHYVREKYYPIMVEDQQEELYKSLMLPSLKLIIQMEMTGMPLDSNKVQEVKTTLENLRDIYLNSIQTSPLIQMLNLILQRNTMESANAKLKKKQHPLEKFQDVGFNPNSGPQLQILLYEHMGLPVIDLTDTKQPATGAKTLEKLINHTDKPLYKDLLNGLINYGKVDKILSTFIPAFERGIVKENGLWLHGNFNLGGTVSGRLSSSDPKFWALQQ